MDPQQELFSALLVKLREAFEQEGISVYDGVLPPKGTTYPFVYLAESQQVDAANKTAVFGSVYQTINVWHNDPHQRGTVSKCLLMIKQVGRTMEHTENHAWSVGDVNQQILPDSSTSEALLHGILNIEFKFS